MMEKGGRDSFEEAFDIKKLTKKAPNDDNIDDLKNDETFGEGAIADDWESFHRTAAKLDNESTQKWPKEKDVMSKFQDISLKDLWGNNDDSSSSFSSSPSSSSTQQMPPSNNIQLAPNIWSSPNIPSPSNRKDVHVVPSMRTVEELEREMALSSPPPPPLSHISSPSHLSSSPSQLSSSPSSSHHHGNVIAPHVLHTLHPSSSPPTHSPPMRPPPLIPYFHHHHMAGPHPHHMMPRGPPPPFLMRGPLPPNVPMMGPPRMIPRGGLMPHPHHMRYPPVMGFRPYMHGPHPPPSNAPTSPPRFPSKLNEMLCDLKPDGSGFMNKKEKEWVIKVQLLQLHTTTPEIDDYYYQRYIEKKFLHEHRSEGIVLTSDKSMENLTLPPPVNSQDDKRRHKPDFENTLGKISVNSVSAPRKTIDAVSQSSSSSEGLKKDALTSSKKRRVLLTIEEMYNLLLKLDGLDVSNSSFGQLQHEICNKIFDLTSLQDDLSNSDESAIKDGELFFQQILHFRKGKSVLQRVLPILSEKQAKIILLCISKSIGNIVRKDTSDEVLLGLIPSVRGIILALNLSEVMLHVSLLTAASTTKLIDNMFFSEYFASFISRGSSLLSVDESIHDLSSGEAQKWSVKLKDLRVTLLNLKAKPTSHLMEEINKSLS